MADPIRELQRLPWQSLLVASGITLLLATLFDLLLLRGAQQTLILQQVLINLTGGFLGLFTSVAAMAIVGAIALLVYQMQDGPHPKDLGTLWGLVGCLVLMLIIKFYLPIPRLLVDAGMAQFFGVIFGVFGMANRARFF